MKREKTDIQHQEDKLPVLKTVRLDRIILKKELQARYKVYEATVNDYANAYEAGSKFPPVKIVEIDKALYLVDGWHRVASLKSLSRKDVKAEITENGTMEEACRQASMANMTNALPLKKGEQRNVFKLYMQARRYRVGGGEVKSLRVIRDELQRMRSHVTLGKWMREDFGKIYERWYAGSRDEEAGGGLRDGRTSMKLEGTVRDALNQAFLAFKAMDDLTAKGGLITEAAFMLRLMEQEEHIPDINPFLSQEDQ